MSELKEFKPNLLFEEDWIDSVSLRDACIKFGEDFPDAVIPARNVDNFLSSKEEVARLALANYNSASDLSSFRNEIVSGIEKSSRAYNLPGNRQLPGPGETIHSTVVNLDRAVRYGFPASEIADGILLSGSVAWGSFFAPTRNSDADMLVSCGSTEDIGKIVEIYSSEGLIKETERKRFEIYHDLHSKQKADVFSIRSFETGGECSLHFTETNMLQEVAGDGSAGFTIVEGGSEFKAVNDFRPNTSSNAKRQGGYVLRIIDGEPKDFLRFHPGNEAVNDNGRLMGYLSESPISGKPRGSERTYAMGVLPFFLSMCPVIISERESSMTATVSKMQQKIADSMNGKTVLNIPRGEIMPSHSLRHIQNLLASFNGRRHEPETTA